MAPTMTMTVKIMITQTDICTEHVYTRCHSKCFRYLLYPHKTIRGGDFWPSWPHPLTSGSASPTAAYVWLENCRVQDAEGRMFPPPSWALRRIWAYKENTPVSGLVPPKSHLPLWDRVSKRQSLLMRVKEWFLLSQMFGQSGNAILLLSSGFTCSCM